MYICIYIYIYILIHIYIHIHIQCTYTYTTYRAVNKNQKVVRKFSVLTEKLRITH